MREEINKDRFFRVNGVLVCRRMATDGRLAMLALDIKACSFKVEAYYFGIFFRNTDWLIIEMNEQQFKKAVIAECGIYPSTEF